MPTWEIEWPKFEKQIKAKLEAGFKEYGDGSFDSSIASTLDELELEAIDLVGWGFIAWVKIQRAKAKAARLRSALTDIGIR